jgi:hypothetical protein
MIVATMLCGNNEAIVTDAISSVASFVDELLLVDTGVTDDSVNIAKRLMGSRLSVVQYKWINDFSNARNFALNVATQKGARWAVTIDTDERLIIPQQLRNVDDVRSQLNVNKNVLAWLVSDRERTYTKERFLRIPTNLTWNGKTHEALVGAEEGERHVLEDWSFFEVPKTEEQFHKKLERDLKILIEETRENPSNARWWYYLGQTLEGLNQIERAIPAYIACAEIKDGWPEQAAWACFCASKCFIKLERYSEAIDVCVRGLSAQPGSPELAWQAGYCAYQLKQFHDAIAWSHMAIAIGAVEGCDAGKNRVGFRHLVGWYEGPYDVNRFAYQQLNLPQAAEEWEQKYHRAKALHFKVRTQPSEVQKSPSGSDVCNRPRIAIFGLYNSGSSVVASMVHRLGVFMGFDLHDQYFEPKGLSQCLREWWNEPFLVERRSSFYRVQKLQKWIQQNESLCDLPCGAKHPLLALCCEDIVKAWGSDLKVIWCSRAIEDSIGSLKKRHWWPGHEVQVQTRLWNEISNFVAQRSYLKIEYEDVISHSENVVERLSEFLDLNRSVR